MLCVGCCDFGAQVVTSTDSQIALQTSSDRVFWGHLGFRSLILLDSYNFVSISVSGAFVAFGSVRASTCADT